MFNKIGILGLGLIGGSLARALKKYNYPATIYGYNRNQESVKLALESGSIDIGVKDFSEFSDCDLIILCCPVNINLKMFESLQPYLKKNVIISDVGSTKGDIYQAIKAFDYDGYFIGGHPMAGSEKTGFQATKAELFENAYYVLTPEEGTPKEYVEEMINMATTIFAIPVELDPIRHDYIVAAISHVPHILASTLVNMVENLDSKDKEMYTLAAGGFKDFTRIASASPDMWQQICLANKDSVLEILDEFSDLITTAKTAISNQDSQEVYTLFEQSRKYRNSFQSKARGSIQKVHAITLDINNEPGVIAKIANYLSHESISIKNIGINNNREDYEGVLEILFYNESSKLQSISILQEHEYEIITD